MKEEYSATQSTFYEFSFLICLLLLVLCVVPGLVYIFYKIISAKHRTITFYKDKIVTKQGIINTKQKEQVFKGVLSVSVNQTLKGKIFKFGDVYVDVAGKHNLNLPGVKNPFELKEYLESRQIESDSLKHVITD